MFGKPLVSTWGNRPDDLSAGFWKSVEQVCQRVEKNNTHRIANKTVHFTV